MLLVLYVGKSKNNFTQKLNSTDYCVSCRDVAGFIFYIKYVSFRLFVHRINSFNAYVLRLLTDRE